MKVIVIDGQVIVYYFYITLFYFRLIIHINLTYAEISKNIFL